MSQRAFWADESWRFFARNFAGADLRAIPPTSYLVELCDAAPVDLRGARVLDLGCGAANNLRWLGQRLGAPVAVGVEPSPRTVGALGRVYPELTFVAADLAALPFGDGAFDLVVLRSVLHWIDRAYLLHTLGEALRVTSRWLVVSDFAPARPYSVPYRGEPGMRTFKADPRPLLTATGLVRETASLLHHDGDPWNCARTTLWRKLSLDEAYPVRDEAALRRDVDAADVAHAARVLMQAGCGPTAPASPPRAATAS